MVLTVLMAIHSFLISPRQVIDSNWEMTGSIKSSKTSQIIYGWRPMTSKSIDSIKNPVTSSHYQLFSIPGTDRKLPLTEFLPLTTDPFGSNLLMKESFAYHKLICQTTTSSGIKTV